MKITFTKDHTDYKKGETVEVSWSIGQAFIKGEYAKPYEKEKSEVKDSEPVKEKKSNAGPGK